MINLFYIHRGIIKFKNWKKIWESGFVVSLYASCLINFFIMRHIVSPTFKSHVGHKQE